MEAKARLDRLESIGQWAGEGFPESSPDQDELTVIFDIAEHFNVLPHDLMDKDASLMLQYMAYSRGKAIGRSLRPKT